MFPTQFNHPQIHILFTQTQTHTQNHVHKPTKTPFIILLLYFLFSWTLKYSIKLIKRKEQKEKEENQLHRVKKERKKKKMKITMRGTFQKYLQLIIFQNGVVVGRMKFYWEIPTTRKFKRPKKFLFIIRVFLVLYILLSSFSRYQKHENGLYDI